MDSRYYDILRTASQETFYQAINNPEEELYEVLWDIFETVVIEPAEIFDNDFRENNQFRYSINSSLILEFFPDISYFESRKEPDPYRDNVDAAGIHLRLAIQPFMSCLFSVELQIWGRAERLAFKKLWRDHRDTLANLLRCAKPTIFTAVPFPTVDHATSLEQMLDNYFSVRDPENLIQLQYPFACFDDTGHAQDFMVFMAVLYHSIRDYCRKKKANLNQWVGRLEQFYSGRTPDLPAPLPCVEMSMKTDF